jgi:redox-sensitive bicupin YhaK (pirin superfamily)
MSAGNGILHSERNDSASEPVHFVQMWVVPDEAGIQPSYQQHEIDEKLLDGALTTIASGMPAHDAAITLHNRNAALHGTRLRTGAQVNLPRAPYLHLFLARGRVNVEGKADLNEGDALRFTDADGRRVTADEPSELLIWEMHAKLGD